MSEQKQPLSEWRCLFRIASSLINQANENDRVIDYWTLGGGTAIMLQINHRESHDVDIFFQKVEFLQFLNPDLRDFEFEVRPVEYSGDGSRFIKFAFEFGEIDFIAALMLTDAPTIPKEVEGVQVLLETVPEIITKKIYHRGASIKPRDIFDIAAANRSCRGEVVDALRKYPEHVRAALSTIDKLNPEFVVRANSDLMIRDEFADLSKSALTDAKQLLSLV